ncbi:hypothetical protein L596_019539 [Steinernema carpocapsae]|uniref:Uncharacterized protein n=1 Tax=Steinernema carpocapsae TaxID=34508 RepID=A0A4U5MQT5_STECR|nr:hypothetical protein L596_019539 [Steinernema carpocapsae]
MSNHHEPRKAAERARESMARAAHNDAHIEALLLADERRQNHPPNSPGSFELANEKWRNVVTMSLTT